MSYSEENHACKLCNINLVNLGEDCPHPKNGYCALFRVQAILDAINYNMHERTEPESNKSHIKALK